MIRASVGDPSEMFGVIECTFSVPSITRNEFANLKVMSAHTTEFGYCTHDYASTPRQKYLDCLNCNELVCIKGDVVREANTNHRQNSGWVVRGTIVGSVRRCGGTQTGN